MHDSMQYEPIQGQGHKPLKLENPSIFKKVSPLPFSMGARN